MKINVYTPVSQYQFDSDFDDFDVEEEMEEECESDELFMGEDLPMSPLGASKSKQQTCIQIPGKGGGKKFSWKAKRRILNFPNNSKSNNQSFVSSNYNPREEDIARAELDGNLPPLHDPHTLIQVKDPSKNHCNKSNGNHFNSYCHPGYMVKSFHSLSRPRKFCFSLALVSSLLFIVVFLWGIPCQNRRVHQQTCGYGSGCSTSLSSAAAVRKSDLTWVRVFNQKVLTSGLEVVHFPKDNHHLLVSGYLQTFEPRAGQTFATSNVDSSGFLAIDPRSGEQVWTRSLFSSPSAHDCNLIDVNLDGVLDCIVVGRNGLMVAINPEQGDILWTLHHHIPLVNLSLPRRIVDLNDDGVSEIIACGAVTLPSGIRDDRTHLRRNIVLISGADGTVLGRPYLAKMCSDLAHLNVTSRLELQFDCQTLNQSQDRFLMTLEEFYLSVTGSSLPSSLIGFESGQFFQFYPDNSSPDKQTTIKDSIHLDWDYLSPFCPECGVNVKLWDGFAHQPLWNQTFHNAIAFQPVSVRFETDRRDSPIEGFAFRLWKWDHPRDTFSFGRWQQELKRRRAATTTTTTTSRPSSRLEEDDEDDSYSLENLYKHNNDHYHDDEEEDSNRMRSSANDWITRFIPFGHPNLGGGRRRLLSEDAKENSNTKSFRVLSRLLRVRESIVYLTLNHSWPEAITLFEHNILQRCSVQKQESQMEGEETQKSSEDSRYVCNPHYNTQTHSMVIISENVQDGSCPDSRDLVFSTQSLISSSEGEEGYFDENDKNTMKSPSPNSPPLYTQKKGSWPLRTTLKKLRLLKDIKMYGKNLLRFDGK